MIEIKQLSVGGFDANFSYFIRSSSGDAGIIDPCGDIDIIGKTVKSAGKIIPRFILITHGHGDHTSGVAKVKKFFDAPIMAHPDCEYPHDKNLADREKLPFGEIFIETIFTPGHSKDSLIFHLSDDSAIFTGDTLFIDYCGYCQPAVMYKTLKEIIYPLADSNEVYSGHHYGRKPHASLGEEKKINPYLAAKNYEDFCSHLKNL